ncbi:hypothetical protein Y032_0034g2867 [Ancylostoma ceylanicum]|uniref:G-protein coupled receptors family 1 profile domain-containing protein n=1 Tax=Ancylostoma ceylanicum TaxID=53326 RepID=A0A016ULF5_9BILA|nr:hypothetical protein Y032_0034g2867 [Ancylostoma ceylanicum]
MLFTNYSTKSYDKTSTYFYAIEGSLLFGFNIFLVCRFLSSKYHRAQKDSLLIVGCLIFDTIFGLTYMCTGIYRLPPLYSYEYFPAISKWECIGTPALLFIIITPTAGAFALITSLDRFYCAMFPIKYLKLRTRYALIVMVAPYIVALAPIIKAIVDSYPYRFIKNEPMTCNLNNALTRGNFTILRMIRVVFTLFCVIVYIPISIKMYRLNLTAVDNDPVMKTIAEKWYEFEASPKQRIIVDDGLRYIREANRRGEVFDVLLIDVSYNELRPLMAPVEAFLADDEIAQMEKVLKKDGAVIVNIVTRHENMDKADHVHFAYSRHFPSCYFMQFAKYNKMLFCSKKEKNSWLDNRDELYNRFEMIDKKLEFNLFEESNVKDQEKTKDQTNKS